MQYSTQAIICVLEALGERKGGGRGGRGGSVGGRSLPMHCLHRKEKECGVCMKTEALKTLDENNMMISSEQEPRTFISAWAQNSLWFSNVNPY